FPPFENADNEPCKIILAVGKVTRMFGRFSANQRAAGLTAPCHDPVYDRFGNFDIELATDKIIKEKKRRCTLGQNIVYTHGDQVDSDSVVNSRHEGDFQLGPNAIGGETQDGIPIVVRLEIEERAEAADTCQYPGCFRALRNGRDPAYQCVTGFDTHAGL